MLPSRCPRQPLLMPALSFRSLSVYLAYIQSSYVDALSAAIKAPNSPFYTETTGLARELAKVVNPTLPITSFAAQGVSNAASADGSGFNQPTLKQGQSEGGEESESDKRRKTIIIASVTSVGIGALAIFAFMAFSRARKSSKNGAARSANSGAGNGNLRGFQLGQNAQDPMRSIYAPGHSPSYAFPGGRANPNNYSTAGRPLSDSSFSSGSDGSDSHGSHDSHNNHNAGWGAHRERHASGRSSSIDFASVNMDDVRNSWWRFSDGFGRAFSSPLASGGSNTPATAMATSPVSPTATGRATFRHNSGRRVNIQRGPDGHFGGISRPQMQENSLML